MKRTFKELREVDRIVGKLYTRIPTLHATKFGYAYKRFAEKNYVPTGNEYNSMLDICRIENALEDPNTKAIMTDLMDDRKYKFSKEGLKAVIAAEIRIEKEYNAKELPITPFISVYVPEDLSEEEYETLKGLIIPDKENNEESEEESKVVKVKKK